MTLLSITFAIASYSDFRTGLIRNDTLLRAAIPLVAINAVYYSCYAREFVVPFLTNLAVMSAISVLLYGYHMWAAGDSKLLILAVSALPARIFYSGARSLVPTIYIVIIAFSIAYVYVIGESVVIGIREGSLFRPRNARIDLARFTKQCVLSLLYLVLADELWSLPLLVPFVENNQALIAITNLFVMLAVVSADVFSKRISVVASAAIAVLLGWITRFQFHALFRIDSYVAVALVILLRTIAEKYNYQTIPTEDARAGMVLSWATVSSFQASRVQGLPTTTTEDIRSAITAREAESILRWEQSRRGADTITIVRKLPFAIYIALGTFAFMAMRLLDHAH